MTTRLDALRLALQTARTWGDAIERDPEQIADMAAALGVPATALRSATLEVVPDEVCAHVTACVRDGEHCPCPPCVAYRLALHAH